MTLAAKVIVGVFAQVIKGLISKLLAVEAAIRAVFRDIAAKSGEQQGQPRYRATCQKVNLEEMNHGQSGTEESFNIVVPDEN
jgi:hypothetical protein